MSRATRSSDNLTVNGAQKDSSPTTDAKVSVCPVCDRFEPQAWRKTMCKNCFHTRSEHGGGKDAGGGEERNGGGGGEGKGVEGGGGGGGRNGGEDSGIGRRGRSSELVGPTGSHEKKKAASTADCATPATSAATAAPAREESASTSNVTSAPASLAGKKATSSADTKNSTTKAYVPGTAVNASANSSTTTSRNTMTATTTTTKTASDSKTTTPSTSTSTTSSKSGTQADGNRGAPSKSSAIAAAAAALSSPTSKPTTDPKKPGIKLNTSTASAKKLAEKFGGLKSPPVSEPARPGKLQLTPKSPAVTKESPFTTGSSSTTATTTTKTATPTLTSTKSTEDKSVKNDGKDLPKKNGDAVSTTIGKLPSEKKTEESNKSTGRDAVSNEGGDKSNNNVSKTSIFGSLKKVGGPPSPSTPGTQDPPPQLKVTTGRRSLTPSSSVTTTPSPSATVSSSPLSPAASSSASSASSSGLTSAGKITPSPQTTTNNNNNNKTSSSSSTTPTKTTGSLVSSTKSNTSAIATTSPLSPPPTTTTATTKTPIATTTKTTTQNTTKAGVAATAATVKPLKVVVASAETEPTTHAKNKVISAVTKAAEKITSDPQKSTAQKLSTTSTGDTSKTQTTTTTSQPKTTSVQKTSPSPDRNTTKMKSSLSSSSGDKFYGQELDSPPVTTPTPKVKTMVVESSKFQKSQAEAAAAAAAAAANVNNQGTIADYRPGEEFNENSGYSRQPSSTRLSEKDPSKMSAYATAPAGDVPANGQNYAAQSYQGSNVTVRTSLNDDAGGAEYGTARSVGEFSRQCSASSTSSSSSDGKVRVPIVVEVQVRRGQRGSVQTGQPTGRSPSPAPAFMVLSPQGNNSLRRSASSGFRSVSGFPSGRTSPVVFGSSGMYGGGYIDDGGGSERGWDSGGSCYSPSPSSCSSPVSSSMRSVYRPSPSPSPTPGAGTRVIPLPVLHTTSTGGAGGGPLEYGVPHSPSPFSPGYVTPSPGFNTPPPPYSPSVDPAPSSAQWKGANYPVQQSSTPYNQSSSSSGGGIHPNYYNTSADAPLNTTTAPNANTNNRAFTYNNSQDFEARDGRPVEQQYQQSTPEPAGYRKKDDSDTKLASERGYAGTAYPGKNEDIPHHPRENNDAGGDGGLGYQQKVKQQQAGEYKRSHSDESAPDVSERGAVSRHPSREDNTVISSADAVVSSGSPAAVSAVAQPPVSISNVAKEEGSSVNPTRKNTRDQGPKELKDEFPDQRTGSKSDRRGSSSSEESLSPEPEGGLSSKERLNFRIQISELEDQVYRLERKNSKIQKEFGEKQALEKIIGELKNQLRSMERKYSGLEEEKKELEDQIQIEKVKVTKGQLESRSLMELRKLLEESDQARMKLTEENELLRDEVNEMKVEIDEMYDQFRESEAEDFRELQKELEITAKNCRILQFKLRKAERRNEQVEADRETYEEKLRTLQNAFENEDARKHIQALEEEVKMAKEVSVRLHDELDILEEKRSRVEEDNRKLQDMLELSDKKNFRMEMEIDKLRDKVSDLQGSLAKAVANNDDSPNKKV